MPWPTRRFLCLLPVAAVEPAPSAKLKIYKGGGEILPTELSHISKRQAREGERLACQVAVKQDMDIEVPPEVLILKPGCVRSVPITMLLPLLKSWFWNCPRRKIDFRAGGYIQIECPPHELKYSDFNVEEEYRPDWDRYHLWDLKSVCKEPVVRAYSMASYPEEDDIVMLNVRVATPPPNAPQAPSWSNVFFYF